MTNENNLYENMINDNTTNVNMESGSNKDNQVETKPHKRRERYKGTHPRKFSENTRNISLKNTPIPYKK